MQDNPGFLSIEFPCSATDLAKYAGVPRTSLMRALKQLGHHMPPVDPNDPTTFRRIPRVVAEEVIPILKRARRGDEATTQDVAVELIVSHTTLRRYIYLGVVKEYTMIRYPRSMYVFTPDQIKSARERIAWYDGLKRKGYRSEALAMKVAERNKHEHEGATKANV